MNSTLTILVFNMGWDSIGNRQQKRKELNQNSCNQDNELFPEFLVFFCILKIVYVLEWTWVFFWGLLSLRPLDGTLSKVGKCAIQWLSEFLWYFRTILSKTLKSMLSKTSCIWRPAAIFALISATTLHPIPSIMVLWFAFVCVIPSLLNLSNVYKKRKIQNYTLICFKYACSPNHFSYKWLNQFPIHTLDTLNFSLFFYLP